MEKVEYQHYTENVRMLKGIEQELQESMQSGTLYEYMDRVLDWEYTVSARGEYKSARVYITLGGPTVWIDTKDATLNLCWGGDRESIGISYEINENLDNLMEEIYENY